MNQKNGEINLTFLELGFVVHLNYNFYYVLIYSYIKSISYCLFCTGIFFFFLCRSSMIDLNMNTMLIDLNMNAMLNPVLFKGMLRCSEVHHGEWRQGLRSCSVWQAERSEGQIHEVCGWPDDPQWRPRQLLRRYSSPPCPAEAGWVQFNWGHSSIAGLLRGFIGNLLPVPQKMVYETKWYMPYRYFNEDTFLMGSKTSYLSFCWCYCFEMLHTALGCLFYQIFGFWMIFLGGGDSQ